MRRLILVLLLTLCGCGTDKIFIHPRLQPLVQEFLHTCGQKCVQRFSSLEVITFAPLQGSRVGEASFRGRAFYSVYISVALEESRVKTVLWHELGHALLHYEHPDGGIMIPVSALDYVADSVDYEDFWKGVWSANGGNKYPIPRINFDASPCLISLGGPCILSPF